MRSKRIFSSSPLQGSEGVTLIEILASLVLFGLLSMAIAGNLMVSIRTSKLTEINHAASSLATSKIEELASISVSNLDASYSGTELNVSWPGLGSTFSRVTTVAVNADDSRDVSVTVNSNLQGYTTSSVTLATRFALWE